MAMSPGIFLIKLTRTTHDAGYKYKRKLTLIISL